MRSFRCRKRLTDKTRLERPRDKRLKKLGNGNTERVAIAVTIIVGVSQMTQNWYLSLPVGERPDLLSWWSGSDTKQQAIDFQSYAAGAAETGIGMNGVLKLRPHTENPGQTPVSHGAGRLALGSGLLKLPWALSQAFGTGAIGSPKA